MSGATQSWIAKERIGLGAWAFWALLAVLPIVGSFSDDPSIDYWLFMGQSMLINTIAILGLNLLIGFNGQISLGHSAFFAIGAYASAILTSRYGWPAPAATRSSAS